jgi:hypothetical protein
LESVGVGGGVGAVATGAGVDAGGGGGGAAGRGGGSPPHDSTRVNTSAVPQAVRLCALPILAF